MLNKLRIVNFLNLCIKSDSCDFELPHNSVTYRVNRVKGSEIFICTCNCIVCLRSLALRSILCLATGNGPLATGHCRRSVGLQLV